MNVGLRQHDRHMIVTTALRKSAKAAVMLVVLFLWEGAEASLNRITSSSLDMATINFDDSAQWPVAPNPPLARLFHLPRS